jgi:hypothetical protein
LEDIIPKVEAEFLLFKNRLIKVLAMTPDDKINWSPSPTARTPLQQVAHVALSIKGMQGMCNGEVMDFSNIAAVDAEWREAEKAFATREQVLALLEANSDAYIAWLDSLTPEQVASTLELPIGPHPLAEAITWVVDHTRSHTSQIEYIQTIYGDLDWHMM